MNNACVRFCFCLAIKDVIYGGDASTEHKYIKASIISKKFNFEDENLTNGIINMLRQHSRLFNKLETCCKAKPDQSKKGGSDKFRFFGAQTM